VERCAPWVLKKQGETGKLNTSLYNLLEGIRKVVIMIYPFIPESASKMLKQLGEEREPGEIRWEEIKSNPIPPGIRLPRGEPVFPKIEMESAV
ncbi:MAG: methionine--tRNA ligase, partial [Candidatus Eremiobacteraeota bacterium]|nr:methionine--tRNA ligase [Candidatus Eremiobacteraeota bacterium]